MPFQLQSNYTPSGDQPSAIAQLTEGVLNRERFQTLLGVTGSGKTFTVANLIQNIQRPTLVLTHNKTLVAQLYGEFKQFFPNNAVGYFVSYYDYYQPEAYMPVSGTYIEKDLSINEELDKLRAENQRLAARAARLEQEPALLAPRRLPAGRLHKWSAALTAVAAASLGFLLSPSLFHSLSGSTAPSTIAAADHSSGSAADTNRPSLTSVPTTLLADASDAEVVAAAKAKPGALNYASAGQGSATHLNAEKFKLQAGFDAVHVPYKGTSQVLADLVSGEVQALFSSMPSLKAMIDKGSIHAIGMTGPSSQSAGIPEISKAGLPGFGYTTWYGMYVPAGTPAEAIERLNGALVKVLSNQDLQQKLASQGLDLKSSTPAELATLASSEARSWQAIITSAGIKAD